MLCFRMVEKQIMAKMEERNDYPVYYYKPVIAKYYRMSRELAEETERIQGEN